LDKLPFLLAKLGLRDVRVTGCGCLGACGGGANLVIYPEGVFHRHVTVENIEELVEQHFIAGSPLKELVVAS